MKIQQVTYRMGRNVLIVIMIFWLTACSTVSNKFYYQLPTTASSIKLNLPQSQQIWLEQFSVADYLNGNGIVYQTNDVRYVMATNNLWGSLLEQQLRQILTDNLNSQLSQWILVAQPIVPIDKRLKVSITGFHGRYDGKIVIRGEWIFNTATQLTQRTFEIEVAQQNDGYDALVKTLAEGWQQQSLAIADQIQTILMSDLGY